MTKTRNTEPRLEHISDLASQLTLEEKVALVSGGSAWGTAPLPSIGLREMVLSDGPSGVRGAVWDERHPSLSLPSGTALAASWDINLARQYGEVIAAEARAHGVDVVLGPTVNLQRSPLGGRHFEAFSEDPALTADLAAAYVEGVQSQGVAASIKHYVANDFETDRFNADVQVSDRALRELYLLGFERAVTEAGVWSVMSAYNSVNGTTATENDLLEEPLNGSWGFDGVVVSDWTAVRSLNSARASQDLAMPGPAEAWSDRLVAAVKALEVDEEELDRKVRRILLLAARVGALKGWKHPDPEPVDGPLFARKAATEGMVLLENRGLLPLAASRLNRIAVVGEFAAQPRIQGGGSATVLPEYVVTPVEGLRAALGSSVIVDYALGSRVRQGFVPLEPEKIKNPSTGGPGAQLTHLDADGNVLHAENRYAGYIHDFGGSDLAERRKRISFETLYTPDESCTLRLGFASPCSGKLYIDGLLVLEETIPETADQVQAFFSPPFAVVSVPVIAAREVHLRFEITDAAIVDGVPGSLAVTFGREIQPPTAAEREELIRQAVATASDADAVVVIVGTDEQLETEGFDRDSLSLPGNQDELVATLLKANPRTVVAVNAGAPVEMPWRNEAAAVLVTWFGGQECGSALADVLLGQSEPGGRLPTTWPARLADAPVSDVTPKSGVVRYSEGIHIGYRAWAKIELRPAYPFGYGLGYTTWDLALKRITRSDRGFDVEVDITNTGNRAGKTVPQVYLRRTSASLVERPAFWLAGFTISRLSGGASTSETIHIPMRAFMHWDVSTNTWTAEAGQFELLLAETAGSPKTSHIVTI